MANSYVEYTTSGSGTNGLGQTTFTAPSKFLNINDIRIKGYNGSTWTELTISSRATTTVTLSATPTSGSYSKIRVFRSSTTESLIDFQAGARLSESDLDTAYQQSLFVAQEVAEVADPDGGSGIGNISNSQLAGGITNDKLAGSIADSKLASGVGTSANNLVKLDGTAKLPAVDGSQLTNVGGKILQVKQAEDQTQRTVNSTSYDTRNSTLSVAITPTSSTSKFLVSFCTESYSSLDAVSVYLTIFRDSTDIGNSSGYGLARGYSSSSDISVGMNGVKLDAPATTAEIIYTVRAKLATGSAPAYFNSQTIGTLTVMEIAS